MKTPRDLDKICKSVLCLDTGIVMLNIKYMKIISKLSLVLTIAIFSIACKTKEKAPKRPNILFIMSDDHAYQAISAYSNKLTHKMTDNKDTELLITIGIHNTVRIILKYVFL